MPNHVHAVIEPIGEHDLPSIMRSIKTFTSRKANELLRRTGPFWQPEYVDHLIRDNDDLRHAATYAFQNSDAAGLVDWPREE